MRLDLLDYIPKKVTPRRGKSRDLVIIECENKLILKAKYCRKDITLNRFIEIDNSDLIAIGLYFAEGNKLVSETSKNHHSGEIGFTNSYLKSIKCFLVLMRKFELEVSDFYWELGLNINYKNNMKKAISYWKNNLFLLEEKMYKAHFKGIIGGRLSNNSFKFGHIKLSFCSVIFRSFLLNFMDKTLDDAIYYKNKRVLSRILEGYFAGDGHVSFNKKNKNNSRRVIEFLCNNLKLFNKLFNCLGIIGCNNLKQTHPERTKTHSKSIRIYNKHDFLIISKFKITNFVDYKSNEFSKLLKSYSK